VFKNFFLFNLFKAWHGYIIYSFVGCSVLKNATVQLFGSASATASPDLDETPEDVANISFFSIGNNERFAFG